MARTRADGEALLTALSAQAGATLPRGHRTVLVLLVVVGLARGLFFLSGGTILWGDEPAHMSYVESIARHGHIPVVAKDHLTRDVFHLVKTDALSPFRTAPAPEVADPALYAIGAEQYEAYQGPLYYTLCVPAWWVGEAIDGPVGAAVALRLFSLLLVLLAIPVLYLAARELFPRRPVAWLLAPMMLVGIQMTWVHGVIICNDALIPLASSLVLLALARCRRGLTRTNALALGSAVGCAALTKANADALVPVVAFALVALLWPHRREPRAALRWVAISAVPAVVLVTPWLAFNLHTYGALSGGDQVTKIVASSLGTSPTGWAGVKRQWHLSFHSMFIADEMPGHASDRARHLWGWTVAVGALAAVVALARRGRRAEAMPAVIGLVAFPVGVLAVILVDLQATGSAALVTGRLSAIPLYPVLFAAVAGAAVLAVGPRIAAAGLVVVTVLAGFVTIPSERAWIASTYLHGALGSDIPTIEQTYADTHMTLSTVTVTDVTCPATYVSIATGGVQDDPALTVDGTPAELVPTHDGWYTYRLPAPRSGTLHLAVPATMIAAVGLAVHRPDVQAAGTDGTPTMRVYCHSDDPGRARFTLTYPPNPMPVSYGELRGWPAFDAWLGLLAAMLGVGAVAGAPAAIRSRFRGASSTAAPR